MKTLSPECYKHVPAAHVANVYAQHASRKAQHAEILRVAERKDLIFLASESLVLADSIAHTVADDAARIDRLEATIPALEKVTANELHARAAFDLAHREYGIGSLERAQSLALRDDFHFADQALGIRKRELAAAVDETRQWTIAAVNVQSVSPRIQFTDEEGRSREVNPAEYIARYEIGYKHRKDTVTAVINREFWTKCLELPEGTWRWIGLHAARVLDDRDLWVYSVQFDEYKTRSAKDCIPAFLERLASLKQTRAAHIRGKVSRAAADLESAKHAASLAGAA